MEEINVDDNFEETNGKIEVPIPTPVAEDEFKVKYNEIESVCSI